MTSEIVRRRHAAYRTPRRVLCDIVWEATGQTAERFEKIVRGYDNEVYGATTRRGECFIVRVRRHGEISFRQEAWALEQCRRAGAPVPEVCLVTTRFFGDATGAPVEVMVQRRMPGRPLRDLWPRLPLRDRERIVAEAGAALRRIHSVPAGGFYRLNPGGVNPAGVWDFPDWDALLRSALRDRGSEAPLLMEAGFTKSDVETMLLLLDRHRTDFPCARPVLCHGDFSPDHLLVDEDRTLRGVIDFGEFQGGAPLHDIAFLSMTCPEADLHWLRRGYGDAGEVWDAAFPERLLLHKLGLQMGLLAHYLRQSHAAEAAWAARGLRETLDAWRAL